MCRFATIKGSVFETNTGKYKIVSNDEFRKAMNYIRNIKRRPTVFAFNEHNHYWFCEFINPNPELRYNELIKIATFTGFYNRLSEPNSTEKR